MPFLFHEVSTYVIQYVTWENAAKFLLWNELGISISILLPSYSSSHSIEFPSYRMLHFTDGICFYTRVFHSMVKFTETPLSNGKNMEYWYQYFSQSMGYFFSVELPSEVLLKRDTPYPMFYRMCLFLHIMGLKVHWTRNIIQWNKKNFWKLS